MQLKAENERFENNMKNVLEIEKKQAKIDVLNELNRRITAIPYQIDGRDVQKEIDKFLKECK